MVAGRAINGILTSNGETGNQLRGERTRRCRGVVPLPEAAPGQ